MSEFKLVSEFKPAGAQPQAISSLAQGLKKGYSAQTLLGVTGSGKTFTIANIIEKTSMPTLIISHNKTLAAQLYNELKEFFPDNHVEYFVSYYDYYQPEAYIARTDTYIEKDASINETIDRLRLSATSSLITSKDVIIVASVSCIYGLGSPEEYEELTVKIQKNMTLPRKELLSKLVKIQYMRNDRTPKRGNVRVMGDTIDIFLGYEDAVMRIEMFGDEIERVRMLERITLKPVSEHSEYLIFPAKHFVMPEDKAESAMRSIEKELKERLKELVKEGKTHEAKRLQERTNYDLEMMRETGYCGGIENYSRHFDKRAKGEPPNTLIDFFPKDFLTIIDESHVTLPQLRGMFHGDYSRKQSLVENGFRLKSAFDNRPLKFSEFEKKIRQIIYVSATPDKYELEKSAQVVEQIVRPTGLIDPAVTVKKTQGQMDDLLENIKKETMRGYRTLVTTLTKRMAEDLCDFLSTKGIKVQYLHSEIDTIERTEIIRGLRSRKFDVLIGVNLLREGLDLPEVSLVAILDADKEGFLRNKRSLIQTMGRASRNSQGRVIMYADTVTESMQGAVDETERRRKVQVGYNKKHRIVPKTIQKKIHERIIKEEEFDVSEMEGIPAGDISQLIEILGFDMNTAAEKLEFEKAIELREKINVLKKRMAIV
ncbi:MAG: excinuclease ABC subunit UvrB [archaeon]|nr:excinuclease ABC subunit UvrB [archaeon]